MILLRSADIIVVSSKHLIYMEYNCRHTANMSGLEAVGIVGSIVRIVDLGARGVLKLYTVYHKTQQMESHIECLSKDVSLW